MKNKVVLAIVMVFLLTAGMAYLLLFHNSTMFSELKTAKNFYDRVSAINYDEQKATHEQLKTERDFVKSEITVLNANIKNLEAEHREKEHQLRSEKTAEISQKASALRLQINKLENDITFLKETNKEEYRYLTSTSDQIYATLLESTQSNAVDIVTFFANEADDGLYSVKFVGYVDSLSNVLDNVVANMEQYGVSIGNISLRQIYSCYDNMRPWDKVSLLEWFDNKYVTNSGEVGSIQGGYIVNGIQLSGAIGVETVASLRAEKENAIRENKEAYDEIIAAIEEERIASIIEAYKGTDAEKVAALVIALNEHYDTRVANANAECAEKAATIAKEYDDRIAAIENGVVEGDFDLANPDLLIFTLDITFSVYTN